MAAPTFHVAGALLESTTTLTVDPNASHSSGDYELLVIETANQAVTLTTAAGFTQHPGSPVSPNTGSLTTDTALTLYERIWNGTDGSPVTDDPGNHVIACILSFSPASGSWSSLSQARSATNGVGYALDTDPTEDTTGDINGLTTPVADCLIIGLMAHAKPDVAGGTTELSGITNSNISGITERFDDAAASGNGGWIGAFTGTVATASTAIGVTTYTKATASAKAEMVIALQPPPPPGTTVTVDTPGAVAAVGKTAATNLAVAVTAGAVAFAGSTTIVLQVGTTLTVDTPGAVVLQGGTAATNLQVGVTPGTVTGAGQQVATNLNLAVSPGSIAVAGATDITLQSATRVDVTTAGQVALTGSSVATNQTQSVTAGTISIAGSTGITLTTSGGGTTLTVDTPGQVAAAGQQVPLRFVQTITPGAVQISGATDVTLQVGARVTVDTPGSLVAAGQQVALNLLLALQPGTISFTGGTVTLTDSGANFGAPVLDALAVLGDVTGAAHIQENEGRAVLREV